MQGRHMYQKGWRLVRLATVLAVLPVAAWAHEAGLEVDEALARGLNVSILFLLSMPLVVAGAIFGAVYLAQKRAQGQARQGRAGTQQTDAP